VADRSVGRTLKTLALVALPLVGIALRPNTAEAQARGTLQAVATVVDTRPSFEGLQAAQHAVSDFASSRTTVRDSVQTVAQVSLRTETLAANPTTPRTRSGALVVTVDFLRN